jgi:hypothetical protein
MALADLTPWFLTPSQHRETVILNMKRRQKSRIVVAVGSP